MGLSIDLLPMKIIFVFVSDVEKIFQIRASDRALWQSFQWGASSLVWNSPEETWDFG